MLANSGGKEQCQVEGTTDQKPVTNAAHNQIELITKICNNDKQRRKIK